jgi:hypothetical protein
MSTCSISPEKEKNSRTSRSVARSEMFRTRTVLTALFPQSCTPRKPPRRQNPPPKPPLQPPNTRIRRHQTRKPTNAHLHGAAPRENPEEAGNESANSALRKRTRGREQRKARRCGSAGLGGARAIGNGVVRLVTRRRRRGLQPLLFLSCSLPRWPRENY